jgi:hypothetical protein
LSPPNSIDNGRERDVLASPDDAEVQKIPWLCLSMAWTRGIHRVSIYSSSIWKYRFTMYCIVMFVVRQRVLKNRDQYPKATDLILNYSIIDDILTLAPTVAAAKRIYTGVKIILATCTMEVHKIASNSEDLLSLIPTVEQAKGFDADTFLQESCPTTYGVPSKTNDTLFLFHLILEKQGTLLHIIF